MTQSSSPLLSQIRPPVKVNKGLNCSSQFKGVTSPEKPRASRSFAENKGSDMSRNWRISSISGILLAAYFIPTWAIIAWRIMISPVQGLFERPNVSVAFFITDHLQLASMSIVRIAWLLALSRVLVVAFFAIFVLFAVRALIRKTEDQKEPLAIALGIGSVISFASVILASKVGEIEALRMHATELLMMLGAVVVMVFDQPARPEAEPVAAQQDLALQQAQLPHNG